MANIPIDAKRFFSESFGQRITETYLGNGTNHANLDEALKVSLVEYEQFGWINALRSVSAGYLKEYHPSKKPYGEWAMHSLDIFRGKPGEGTTLGQFDVVASGEEDPRLETLSFVYLSLTGQFTARFNDTLPLVEDAPLPGSQIETTHESGTGLIITDWPEDHAIEIPHGSEIVRFSFT